MFKNIFSRWRKGSVLFAAFLFLATITFTVSSCKKKDNLLGGKAYDQGSLLSSGGIDTFSIKTYTTINDSIKASNPRYGLLGIINDPEFGIVDLGFYTQVRLAGLNPNFGNIANITIDSFVLAMEYAGSYGYNGKQTLEVYELDERMYADSSYYTSKDLQTKTENWVNGSGYLDINPNGITVIGSDTVATQLRIPLKPAKALQIIQDATNFPAEFGNNNLFSSNYLKGLYVKTNGVAPAVGSGMVGYFNLLDQDSRIIIYYKEAGESRPPFSLIFNNDCIDYNRYKINNSGKRIASVLADANLGQTEFYAQSGLYSGVVEFPTLNQLPKNIVIHSAVLQLPIQFLSGSKFTYAPTIILSNNSVDLFANYDPYIKGYTVNLKGFVQDYVVGVQDDPVFKVSPGNFISSLDRVVFNGPLSDKKVKPRLIITYTEF